MVYRVELDISFAVEQDMVDFLNYVENFKSKAALDNREAAKITVIRHCRYHKCSHDIVSPTPCKDYKIVNFDGAILVHTKGELDTPKEA